jgi:hypothetical protein
MSCALCTGSFSCVQDSQGIDWCTMYVTNDGCQHLIGGCPGPCGPPTYCGTGCCAYQELEGDFGVSQGTCVDASMCP